MTQSHHNANWRVYSCEMDQAGGGAYSSCSSPFTLIVDQGSSQRRPLEMPPGLTEISHPCKKGREALNYKVLRVLHTLQLTYMEHQEAVEKAQAAAAPWKAKLQNAWKDVPLPDADEEEFATWLQKWDSSTNVDV